MANGFKVRLDSIATDGTNYFVTITVNDGAHASPPMTPVFPVSGASAGEIDTYIQAIADNGSSLTSDIAALVGKTYTGA